MSKATGSLVKGSQLGFDAMVANTLIRVAEWSSRMGRVARNANNRRRASCLASVSIYLVAQRLPSLLPFPCLAPCFFQIFVSLPYAGRQQPAFCYYARYLSAEVVDSIPTTSTR